MSTIKKLFSDQYKVMAQKSVSDITGSATPIESSDYIEKFLARKRRYLPPINFATASNFAKFGSAVEYSSDAIKRIYNTYPYDGSLAEKIDWHNRSNFYDLYLFEHRYPRTCGYATFSPDGWVSDGGSQIAGVGKTTSPEFIRVKGGPHADPNSGSLKLSRQFPEPWDGRANVWDSTTGINRESNLALDFDEGVTVEFWLKKPSFIDRNDTRYEMIFDLWNGKGDASFGQYKIYSERLTSSPGELRASLVSGSYAAYLVFDDVFQSALQTTRIATD